MANATDGTNGFGSPAVEIPVGATSVDQIVRFLIDALVSQGRLRSDCAEQVCDLVLHRESLGATAIGRGIAIPHAQTDLVKNAEVLVGRCVRPVHWPAAGDGQPVDLVCLAISPDSPGEFGKMLELVARRLKAIKGG